MEAIMTKVLCIAFIFFDLNIQSSAVDNIYSFTKYSNNKPNLTKLDTVKNSFNIQTIAATSRIPPSRKKWQVGRVSRKQYEIINMLWRTTNKIDNVGSTANHNSDKTTDSLKSYPNKYMHLLNTHPTFNHQTSTASYIEFYYLDEIAHQMKQKDNKALKIDKQSISKRALHDNLGDSKTIVLQHPLLRIHVNNDKNKQLQLNFQNINLRNATHLQSSQQENEFNGSQLNSFDVIPIAQTFILNDSILRNATHTDKSLNIYCKNSLKLFDTPNINNTEEYFATPKESIKFYDKVKFFEIYDNNTLSPQYFEEGSLLSNENDNYYHDINSNNQKNISSENIIKLNSTTPVIKNVENITLISHNVSYVSQIRNQNILNKSNYSKSIWSKYSFTSVYIHEPSMIRCDAAAITNHWLIVAGSCLSQRHKYAVTDGTSAYVAYCHVNWWQTEVLSYVRSTFLHPRYNANDKIQRYLYNIGLIQVINSMADGCRGWKPVTLMSHTFITSEEGNSAIAVGWGLDRYKTKYSFDSIPKRSLAAYEGIIYSKWPGNKYCRNIKRINEEIVKDMYFLILPSKGKINDTMHGSLLLVEGKLMALYLQREKGSRYERYPQYTGIWRLISWIRDLAQEPKSANYIYEL